jgi:Family of unknown function (DUF5764)
MDDFVPSTLNESRNEWASRLINILTPLIIEGIRSIFDESWKMCVENDEVNKYLMTFQNMLTRVSKWNSVIIEEEVKRIIERSGCGYLADLITCVHIIQLKVLTSIRVGNKQKKIDITIPKLDHFIHKVYVHVARKVYKNVYLFEKNITPLQIQKNYRELEMIVQECILNSIRDSIPTEAIIRAYLDESVEQEEEVIIEHLEDPVLATESGTSDGGSSSPEAAAVSAPEPKRDIPENPDNNLPEIVPSIKNIDNEPVVTRLSFNDLDSVLDDSNKVQSVNVPKTVEHLEKISMDRAMQRKMEEEDDDRIRISTEPIDLAGLDILDIDGGSVGVAKEDALFDFEELN